MKFEFFPNEILIECFVYLNTLDIFYSFDQLNYRFYQLIRNIPLQLDFEHVPRSIFEQFCMKMLSYPEIKKQIYSLHLSDENTNTPMDRILSLFSLDELSHLRFLTLTGFDGNLIEKISFILVSLRELQCFHIINPHYEKKLTVFDLSAYKLKTLSISIFNSYQTVIHYMSSLINLTISLTNLCLLWKVFQDAPMLKYLNINLIWMPKDWTIENMYDNNYHAVHLKQLIITGNEYHFHDIEILLKRTPNLISLTLSGNNNNELIDAYRWEHLITSSLPRLTIFKFELISCNGDDIPHRFKQFQSAFWLEQHHWYTEYALFDYGVAIYTVPYISNKYILRPCISRYSNHPTENTNTFNNVTKLYLCHEAIIEKSQFYFPHVTSLTLTHATVVKNEIDNPFRKKDFIEYMKMIINLFNLKHLDISRFYGMEITSVLLQILKETPQLSSMRIRPGSLSLFYNDELCKYLNKMMRKIDMFHDTQRSFDDIGEVKQFCQIFSNIEQLICRIDQIDQWLFLLKHLPKLLYVQICDFNNSKHCSSWFQKEAHGLDVIFHIKSGIDNRQKIHIWIHRSDIF